MGRFPQEWLTYLSRLSDADWAQIIDLIATEYERSEDPRCKAILEKLDHGAGVIVAAAFTDAGFKDVSTYYGVVWSKWVPSSQTSGGYPREYQIQIGDLRQGLGSDPDEEYWISVYDHAGELANETTFNLERVLELARECEADPKRFIGEYRLGPGA